MRNALLILIGVVVGAIAIRYFAFPRNMSITLISSGGGGSVTYSSSGLSFEAAPYHYATNGFDHIGSYVSQLLEPTNGFKSLSLFTPDGTRGFGLEARNGVVHASLTVEWRQQPQKEAAIRK